MTNFKLNKAIAMLLFPGCTVTPFFKDESRGEIIIIEAGGHITTFVNYCQSWGDLMPLVIKYRIDLSFPEEVDYFIADKMLFDPKPQHVCPVICKNPQRALAECLLKVLTN